MEIVNFEEEKPIPSPLLKYAKKLGVFVLLVSIPLLWVFFVETVKYPKFCSSYSPAFLNVTSWSVQERDNRWTGYADGDTCRLEGVVSSVRDWSLQETEKQYPRGYYEVFRDDYFPSFCVPKDGSGCRSVYYICIILVTCLCSVPFMLWVCHPPVQGWRRRCYDLDR